MPKKLLRGFLSLLIIAGLSLALWPLAQTVYADWSQNQLRAQWDKENSAAPKPPHVAHKPQPKVQNLQPNLQKQKWPPTRLIIPGADVDVVVLDGWDEKTLAKAPGHWPASALPGQNGNCAIAGHRNIYGSPFYKVDELQPGAPIELRTAGVTYLYRVIEVKAVGDADTTVLQPSPDGSVPALLTLVTCTLPRTANRIVVSANLESAS